MKRNILTGLCAATAVTSLLSVSTPAQAFSFGTGGIQFDSNTNVDFTFNESHGSYTSSLKIFEVGTDNTLTLAKDLFSEIKQSDNGSANGWLGTCGKTVITCNNSFQFLANKTYTFALSSNPNGIVYSTNSLNTKANGTLNLPSGISGTQQAVFGAFGSTGADGTKFTTAANFTSGNPFAEVVKISFDDRGNGNDADYQDFSFTAKATKSVPEPSSFLGLGMVAGSLAVFGRRHRR